MVQEAQPYFRMLAQRAAEHGLTQADVPMLAQLATALWMADAAAAQIVAEGLTTTDTAHGDGTEPRKHPAVSIWRAAVGTADALAKQFGLTPASRARLGLEEESDEPSLAEVLFGEAARHAK
jgi:P27 family predicted phage terminase small subunit